MTYDQIAALTGQDTGGPRNELRRLKINSDPVDDEGKPLPYGEFWVHHPEHGPVFGKPVMFRPFIQVYQYIHYDPKEKKFVNKTIQFKDFRQEQPDELGGLRCGKVRKQDFDGLTHEQQEVQKQIKCYRILYGVVRYEGKTKDGSKVDVEMPVELRLRGKNFMPIGQECIDILSKQKKLMFNYELKLSNRREKNGDTAYFIIEPSMDMTKTVPFTQDDMELLKKFQETIDVENQSVMEKYKAALAKNAAPDDDEEQAVSGVLESDLEDEIPFDHDGTIIDAG